MSLNAWGGAKFDELAAWIPTCAADVLCFQEITRTPGVGGWTQFADGERTLPQRANLYEDLRSLLPNHQAVFLTNDTGPVTDSEGRVHRQDFGLAIFIAESIPIIGQRSDFVHRQFVDHTDWAIEDRPRAAQGVRLFDRPNNRNVSIVHAHGLRDPAGKHDTSARLAQATRLADLVVSTRSPNDFVVVCGDLNVLPGSGTFPVLNAIGLTDLVGERDTRTSSYPKQVRHANYLLVSDPDAVLAFETPATPEVSDHRPLILDV